MYTQKQGYRPPNSRAPSHPRTQPVLQQYHQPVYSRPAMPPQTVNPYRERRMPQMQQRPQAPVQAVPYQYQPRPERYNQQHQQYGPRLNAPQFQPPPQKQEIKEQYILYYSNYCLNSKEFINILCKTSYYDKFKKINISAPNTARPGFLRHVPTIIVPGADRPLSGEEVFRWLETQTEERNGTEGNNEIMPYLPGEMGTEMGSVYSYLDIKDTEQPMEHQFVFIGRPEEKINTPNKEEFVDAKPQPIQGVDMTNRPPLPQALQHQLQHTPGVTRPPMIPQSTGSDHNKDDFDKAFNDLVSRRKMETPNPVPRE